MHLCFRLIGGDIASFSYPSGSKVGNFVNPNVASPESILIAARSKYLVAAYSGQNAYSIAVWSIDTGCTLRLLNTVAAPQTMLSIALSPDSKTLAVAYFGNTSAVDSFSLGPNGQL